MKKIIALILALSLCLCLFVGCGKDDADIGGTISPAETPAPEEEAEFEAGVTIGGTYTNSYIGISCTLDESWIYFDEAQLAELNGLTVDAFDDEEIKEQLSSANTVYDMYAMNNTTGSTINIVMENLGLVYGTILSESDYADISIQQLPAALESAGFSNIACEKTSVSFAGADRTAINISAMINEIPIFETLVCIKAGSHMTAITVATFYEDTTADILACFSAA